MILYFRLLPDILSALMISADTAHRACPAAPRASPSSPGSPLSPGRARGHPGGSPGAALTGDEAHAAEPRPHQETEPAGRAERLRLGPVPARPARAPQPPQALTGHWLRAPAGSAPCTAWPRRAPAGTGRAWQQQPAGAGWAGSGAAPAHPGTFRMDTLAMRSRGLIRSASMNRSFVPGSCGQGGMGQHPRLPAPGPSRPPPPAPRRDPRPGRPRTCSSR